MCGRFNVVRGPGLEQLLGSLDASGELRTGCNIAPTETISMVVREDGATSIRDARWWLTPSWSRQVDQRYSMFNARAETLAKSRAFAKPFRQQRGIVPVSSFIEWQKTGSGKRACLISNREHALALAAVFDVWRGEETPLTTCALVTTEAAPAFRPIHGRMPVALSHDEQQRWLDNHHEIDPDDPLFGAVLKFDLGIAPLAAAVGNSRNKDPELMHPVAETDWLQSPGTDAAG
jgi:putative SOS response-associated peptidase YedK